MRSHSLRYLLLLSLSSFLLLTLTNTAYACSCGPRPTVLEALGLADEVVIGRVASIEKFGDAAENRRYYVDDVRSATVVIERVFKGKLNVRDQIVFKQGGGSDCVLTFNEQSVGQQILFYLRRPEKNASLPFAPAPGMWLAFGCGRTTSLNDASEDLLYLENISKLRGKTRISGSIGWMRAWTAPGLDVEGKTVKIIGPKKTYETRTNKEGVFEIYDLPPGKYVIEPETPLGWKIDPTYLSFSSCIIGNDVGRPEMPTPRQVAIRLQPQQHAAVYFAFTFDNRVSGRVVGPLGKPLQGVCLYLLRSGQDKYGPSDCTDEQGRFNIESFVAGEYVLVANPQGKPNSREPFARIFYPGTSERERASVIRVSPGETVDNIDFVIPKLEETITVKGTLRYSDGSPVVDEWVRFKVQKTDNLLNAEASDTTDSKGRFTLRLLKGLTGELSGEQLIMEGLYKKCLKVDELLAGANNKAMIVGSNVVKLTTDQDLYNVELTLPVPRCEEAKP